MQLTFTFANEDVISLDVSDELTVADLKALLELESSISSSDMVLLHNMTPITDAKKTIKDLGIRGNDVIQVTARNLSQASEQQVPKFNWSQIQVPSARQQPRPPSQRPSVDQLWQELRHNQSAVSHLAARNPPLAQSVLDNNYNKFVEILERQQAETQFWENASANPFSAEVQGRIADNIQQVNIEQNMMSAMEHVPETFAPVTMLYINCKANSIPLKGFVDSGAQNTIMSSRCAERCNVMHLVDRRWQGTARGVGEQKIVGRIHLCSIQIGNDFLPCSFSILERQEMDFMLGLDMLKRHQCCIDLQKNVLRIGTTGNEVPFLSEGDLPAHARLAHSSSVSEEEDKQLAEAIGKSQTELKSGNGTQDQASLANNTTQSMINSASIDQIVRAGFTREEAVSELQLTEGNVDLALAKLFARSFRP